MYPEENRRHFSTWRVRGRKDLEGAAKHKNRKNLKHNNLQVVNILWALCVAPKLLVVRPPLPGHALRSRRPTTGVSRVLRARVSWEVSPKTGVSDGVSHGVFQAPFGPRAPECPKSVPRVSPECLDTFLTPGDTLGTLFGHFGVRGPKGPGTSCGTLRRTPPRKLAPEGLERPL